MLVWVGIRIFDGRANQETATEGPYEGQRNKPQIAAPSEADVEAQLERLDPSLDGWDIELFQQEAGAQLKKLGKLLSHVDTINDQKVRHLCAAGFITGGLRPTALQASFADPCLTVYRPAEKQPESEPQTSLATALQELAEPLTGAADTRVKFKIFNVQLGQSAVSTTSYYQATGDGRNGRVQQSATWHCRWTISDDGAPPRLNSIRVEDFEEVINHGSKSAWFSDCTTAVLGANTSFHQQMLPGLDHWRQRLPKWTGSHFTGHHGLAVGDVNGDGLDDVYVCRPGGLPNRLFLQTSNGTARDVSREAGVDWLDYSASALLVDLDNDGDQDLALAAGWGVIFMSNDGSGRFSKKTAVAVFEAMMSMSAADADLDGDLDVYVCVYGGRDASPLPYHDANNGGRNFLLRNDGQWQFTDVTESVGLDQNNRRFSFAASWEDYDQDGDPDLYVANDYGRNNLYQNNNGRFTDAAASAGVEDIAAGMSVDWADYNADGLMDLYVSNMFSSAGNRVTYQRRFKGRETEQLRRQFQRHARGNSLFENAGDGTFRDVSVDAGVTMGRWAWGSNFIDVNNDGREDIFVANGYVTQEDNEDL